ncbi:RNA polymerase II mediator complex subunit [Mortierella sp. GBA30]|nr:RNA polymerase II mediator complex subunit [Mortierella sp. GBA30]
MIESMNDVYISTTGPRAMESQHSDKRIKLFLERSVDRLPFDITQKAEEIYLPDGDPAEKLKRKIKAITDAAGDSYDQFTDNIVASEEQQQEPEQQVQERLPVALPTDEANAPASESHVDTNSALISTTTNAAATAAANARISSPQGIYIKLWHAQSEIGMALDALNIILSSYQSVSGAISVGSVAALPNPNAPPTALPPGSLKCEYVPRPQLPLSTQIANEKMALGGKKHHLRSAADILIQGARKLKKVMADEDQFWAGALRLRKNNWCIVSAKAGAGPGLQHHQHQHLFVHYGFRDVGSLYPERAYAELVRNPTTSDSGEGGRLKSIQLHIPNKTDNVVVMSLVWQGEPHIQVSRAPKSKNKYSLHSQLLAAQNTLFDAEIFHELINEARTMVNSVSIVNNEIFLPINDELELKIAYRSPMPEHTGSSFLALPSSTVLSNTKAKCLEETADILRYAMQLIQHRRHRQNIKERSDSFFKSSRPGGGRTAGSFGQIQQTLQQRPTHMLSMILQSLQYYTFSKRIREVLDRVTKNLRQGWWEPISVHSVDIKSPPSTSTSSSSFAGSAPYYGMGSSVSIKMGSKAPALRFVLRSHPAPCAVLQVADRPSVPIMHITQFEQLLEEELAARAIGRICEAVNSIQVWKESMPGLQSPRFEIDIERRCVGVFEIPQRNRTASLKIFLRLDMKTERAISITLTSSQGSNSKTRRIYLEDQRLQINEKETSDENRPGIHPYDESSTSNSTASSKTHSVGGQWSSMEGFRAWLKQNILVELEL